MPISESMLNGLFLGTDDGQVPFMKVPEFTFTRNDPIENEGTLYVPSFRDAPEYCVEVNVSMRMRRTFERIVYGWKARGPIRKRVLHKLWRGRVWQD